MNAVTPSRWPVSARTSNATKSTGMLSAPLVSVAAIRATQLVDQPEYRPISRPINSRSEATLSASVRVGRTPQSRRLSVSRPSSSVPRGKSATSPGANGGRRNSPVPVRTMNVSASGSRGASCGPSQANPRVRPTRSAPSQSDHRKDRRRGFESVREATAGFMDLRTQAVSESTWRRRGSAARAKRVAMTSVR